jgi:uncharacterized protein (TIGR00369 family)
MIKLAKRLKGFCFMKRKESLKRLPSRNNSMCFGCSPVNPTGLRLEFFTDEESIFSWVTVPEHLSGWKNLVHGGIISTILDEVMGRSVIYKMKRLAMTKSMTVDFLKPIPIDKELRAEARLIEIKSEREVLVEGLIFSEAGELCARSRGTFAFFKPDDGKKLGIKDEDTVIWFNSLI